MNIAQIVEQLNPANQKLAEALIAQLAQLQGIQVNGDVEMPEPLDSIPLWVAWLKGQGRSPRTIAIYRLIAANYLRQDPHPTSLSIQAYVAQRLERFTPSGVNTEINALKSLFSYLAKQGLWNNNPWLDIDKIKETKVEIECPSNDTIMALFQVPAWRNVDKQKFQAMLFLLINTGLRISEACSLRRSLVNLSNGEIKVIGKGNKERTVPISALVVGLLREYMVANPADNDYVFTGNGEDGYWHTTCFRRSLTYACQKAKVKRIRPHQLRHFFATRTLEHGAKLEVISKILGHANVGITIDVYRHIQLREFHEEHAKHDPLEQLSIYPTLTNGKHQKEVINGEYTEIKGGD